MSIQLSDYANELINASEKLGEEKCMVVLGARRIDLKKPRKGDLEALAAAKSSLVTGEAPKAEAKASSAPAPKAPAPTAKK